ncbi:MAG: FecR domain-containing protein, partial [Sphingomonas bacterium]
AAVVAAVGGGLLEWRGSHPEPAAPVVAQAPATLYQTARGEQRTIRLADGSEVTLDTATRLEVAPSGPERRLRLLGGQAFFRVAKDHAHPFVVAVGANAVTALGTRFAVRTDIDRFSVTLVEGSVRVDTPAAGRATILKPGSMLTEQAHEVTVSAANDRATGWMSGRLKFEATPLAVAVAEMNRYAARKLVLADPALADRPISGVFRTDGAPAFVRALEAAGIVRADEHDSRAIYLRRF